MMLTGLFSQWKFNSGLTFFSFPLFLSPLWFLPLSVISANIGAEALAQALTPCLEG